MKNTKKEKLIDITKTLGIDKKEIMAKSFDQMVEALKMGGYTSASSKLEFAIFAQVEAYDIFEKICNLLCKKQNEVIYENRIQY